MYENTIFWFFFLILKLCFLASSSWVFFCQKENAQFWWQALKNFRVISWEEVLVTDSSEIFMKFPGIGPNFERFFGNQSFETKFRENSWEFFMKFPPRNFWELLRNISLEISEKCSGLIHYFYGFLVNWKRDIVLRNSWEFLHEISNNFWGIFLWKF